MTGVSMSETSPAELREGTFVVIPAYNEAPCLQQVIEEVRAQYPNVVVVDDGSSDDTYGKAKRSARFALRHVVNRGQGAALQTGIEFALSQGARFIVTFDADGQHRVEDIQAMVGPVLSGECDVTLGSRFLGGARHMPASRRLTLCLAVWFTRALSRVHVTDAHNGFRAFSRGAAEKVHITLDRMAHASELIDQIHQAGLRFQEVPVQVRYTDYSLRKGQSSRGAIQIAIDYLLARVLP